MKIALTGGAGFIASHVADAYLHLGHEVHIFDNLSMGKRENLNPAARFFEIDISSPEISRIFESEKYDLLNHHAAQLDVRVSVRDPLFDANTNILGSLNLYEAARNSGIRKIIFASSGGTVYGEQIYFPADEEHPTNPCSPYGIAKLTNEKYLAYYRDVWGIPFTVLRYANIYGPRQNPHGEAGVVAIFTDKMLAGEQAFINGDGKITRDYIFISDVVRANIIALGESVQGIYNIGTGIEHDVNYIFRHLKELTGSDIQEIHAEAKAGEQLRSVIANRKFFEEHGWKPEISFLDGLKLTVESFRKSR